MRTRSIEVGVGVTLAFAVMIWLDPWPVVKWAGLILGIGLIVWGIWGAIRDKNNKTRRHLLFPNWNLGSINLKEPPFTLLVSLKEAAEIAYKKTKKGKLAKVAEVPIGQEQADPLNLYAIAVAGRSDNRVRLFGELPPSKWLREIPADDAQWGKIKDRGYRLDANKTYKNLHITRRDFRRQLERIRNLDKSHGAR